MNFKLHFTVKDRRLNKAKQRIFEPVSPELQPSLEKLFSFASFSAASSAKKAKKASSSHEASYFIKFQTFFHSFSREKMQQTGKKLSMKKRMEQRE